MKIKNENGIYSKYTIFDSLKKIKTVIIAITVFIILCILTKY